MYTDSIEQLRGTAGARQVRVRAETALAAFTTPSSGGWIMFGKSPSWRPMTLEIRGRERLVWVVFLIFTISLLSGGSILIRTVAFGHRIRADLYF
jgi:hypothetical protein